MRAHHVSIRRGAYHDSVTLLRISQTAAATAGVPAVQVAMATPLNSNWRRALASPFPPRRPQ